jgi:hypothetical protein
MPSAVVPLAIQGAAALSRPGRWLPPGAPLLYGDCHPEKNGERGDYDGA